MTQPITIDRFGCDTLKKYYWPEKNKLKTYQKVRDSGDVLINFIKNPYGWGTMFCREWQTSYGVQRSVWYLIPEESYFHGSYRISQPDFEKLKSQAVTSAWHNNAMCFMKPD